MAVVKCPICSKAVVWNADNPYRPFCSERCKNVDLGAWASERYSIPDAQRPGEDNDDLPD